jgi:membrane protease YdiL (CAAX protease family)
VLFALLTTLTGSAWIAALLASAAFGVSHMVQGAQSALIISAIALALHGLVAVSGSIYLAIVVHFLYDLIAGFSYGRLGERYGYPREGVTA